MEKAGTVAQESLVALTLGFVILAVRSLKQVGVVANTGATGQTIPPTRAGLLRPRSGALADVFG